MDVLRSQIVAPALSVALLLGFGIVGKPGLGVAADVLMPDGTDTLDEDTDFPDAGTAAGTGFTHAATAEIDESERARSDDIATDTGGQSVNLDDGSEADSETDLSLFSPDSAL